MRTNLLFHTLVNAKRFSLIFAKVFPLFFLSNYFFRLSLRGINYELIQEAELN